MTQTQRYWDGEVWTDNRAPAGAAPTRRLSTIQSIGVVLLLLAALWFLAYNTNPGKKALAYLGIEECVEITLTGNVVCGDEAEKLLDVRRDLQSIGN